MDTELMALTVRIQAEAAGYQAQMRAAAATTQQAAAAVQAQAGTIESFGRGLQGFAVQVGGAIAAITAGWVGGNTFGLLQQSFGMFAEHESVQLKLAAAVSTSGAAVASTLAEYKEFADEMARTTVVGKDSVAVMLQQAASFGVTGAAAERAVRNTIAAQAAGLPVSVRQMTMLEEGNTRMLLRVLPGLRNLKTETERVAFAEDRLGKMFAVATAEAASAGGQLKQLQNAYAGLQKAAGEVVAEAARPIIAWLKDVVGWFQALPKEAKTAIVVVGATAAALVTGFAAATAAAVAFGVAVNVLGAGIPLLIGAVVTGLGLAAGGTALVVEGLGGIGPVFASIKKWAYDAWAWLKPTRQALWSFFTELWHQGQLAFEYVKQAAVGAWKWIAATFHVSWDGIQSALVDGIVMAEYAMTHFKEVVGIAWTFARLKVAEFIAINEYAFGTVLPAALQWLQDNWPAIFRSVLDWTLAAVKVQLDNIYVAFTNFPWQLLWKGFKESLRLQVEGATDVLKMLPQIVAGQVKFSDVWKDAATAPKELFKDLPSIINDANKEWAKLKPFTLPTRELSAQEKALRAELQKQLGGYNAFRDAKLKEWAKQVGASMDANVGKKPPPYPDAAGIAKAAKELDKWDAALAGSVEAAFRVEAYRAALLAPVARHAAAGLVGGALGFGGDEFGDEDVGGGGGGGAAPGGTTVVVPVAPAAPPAEGGQAVGLLKQIRDILAAEARKKGIDIGVAGVNG